LCFPAIRLFDPTVNLSAAAVVKSEADLRRVIEGYELSPASAERILEFVRDTKGLWDLGERFCDEYGSIVQLGKWNDVFIALGDSPLKNKDAGDEFKT